MQDKLTELAFDITGYRFNDMDSLFSYLKIPDTEWSIADASEEFEALLESEQRGTTISGSPQLTVVSGIPYSGKSTYVSTNKDHYSGYVDIAFDDLMRKLSYYHQLAVQDSKLAFERCELIARVLGYELIHRSAIKGANIILEHSSTPEQHLDFYLNLQQKFGYQIEFIYIACTLEQALNRAQNENMKRDGERYTPPEYIEQRYHLLQDMLIRYQKNFTIKVVE